MLPNEFQGDKYLQAFTATFIISLVPNVLLFLIPSKYISGPVFGINFQHIMLSFAAGALLGDVFIHALPHLLSPHDDHHEHTCGGPESHENHDSHEHHEHSLVGVHVLIGFFFFFFLERLVSRYVHHDHNHTDIKKKDATPTSELDDKTSSAGYLNLFADSMHNFTDGLALGAAFSSGKGIALATMVSVFFHEIPHELGDFSILIQSGFTKWQAIRAQFLTATAAFLGTALGLFSGINDQLERFLLASTCGGFVYVATVGVLPSINSGNKGLGQILLESLGFVIGVGLMVLVAMFEEEEQ